ncbi:MAG: hypothetical protein HY784_10495 [Chloroflexi bacterium]|nr:hypothetical protein [Chloroflexota bacterium]
MDNAVTIVIRIPAQETGVRAWRFELADLTLRAIPFRDSSGGNRLRPAQLAWMGKIVAELGGHEADPGLWTLPNPAARDALKKVLAEDPIAARFLMASHGWTEDE